MPPYLSHLPLTDPVSTAILAAGFTLALLLAAAKRLDQKANRFLAAALIASVSPYLLPALGPLLLLYTRQRTAPNQRLTPKDALHFIPILAAPWLPTWLPPLSITIYISLAHQNIEACYEKLQPFLMDKPRFAFRGLDQTLNLLSITVIASLLSQPLQTAITIILLALAAAVLIKPDTPTQLTHPITDKTDIKQKARRLKEAVATNRLYEDPDLTLATLAVKLQIPPHDLSKIINTGLETNFSDFINQMRVRDIIQKIQNPKYDQITLLGIAYEAGFNSKTTFNRVFKEMTGKTPAEYKNSLKNKVPDDRSAPRHQNQPVLLRQDSRDNQRAQPPTKRNNMLKSHLTITYRQLKKQKLYAAIKIGGFALGIAACLIIGLYIRDDMGHDQTYPGADRIYRIFGDGTDYSGWAWPAPMAKAIEHDFPEVQYAGRIQPRPEVELQPAGQTQNTYEQLYTYADQSFMDAFELPVIYGDKANALSAPQTMIITKPIADKYYRGQNPVGKTMYLDNDKAHPYRITAVLADIPNTSHLKGYNFFLSLTGKEFWGGEGADWSSANYMIYVKLKPGTNKATFEKKLNEGIKNNYFLPEWSKGGGAKDAKAHVNQLHFRLQAVTDINLYAYNTPDGMPHGDIRFIWLFGAIAIFILIIACINFINLTTARSANRAKEVGLKKVLGSYRSSLIHQFLTESVIYSLVSFILGLLIAWLALPYFNRIAERSLTMPWTQWWLAPSILASALIVGALAGLYPAVYLSRFRPAQVLKGTAGRGTKNPTLRNSLVVFQFATSIILIISTIVIYRQTNFILTRKIGFDKDQVMILHGTNTLSNQKIQEFKRQLTGIPSVRTASISDYLPIWGTKRNGNTFFREGRQNIDPGVWGQHWQIDESYLKTLNIKLIRGRNFSSQLTDDTTGKTVIINQLMAEKLHLKDPIDQIITNGITQRVIGVIDNFNFESMRGDIAPMVMHFELSTSMITIKFNGRNTQQTLQEVTNLWKTFSPDQPIRFTFLDQEFAAMYADVTRTGKIFTSFAVLAIIVACLGLFALSAFMAEQRSKEVGIRKVLGATVQGITTMLSADFIKLVILAIFIASPIAWWLMHKWLQEFAYRIDIAWWMFAAAGATAILIAFMTVSFQSVKAALTNPVKSLRSE